MDDFADRGLVGVIDKATPNQYKYLNESEDQETHIRLANIEVHMVQLVTMLTELSQLAISINAPRVVENMQALELRKEIERQSHRLVDLEEQCGDLANKISELKELIIPSFQSRSTLPLASNPKIIEVQCYRVPSGPPFILPA